MSDGTYTRKDYMDKRCTHREYYAQFVTEQTISEVVSFIGADKILASTDRAFNDIPLRRWDALIGYNGRTLRPETGSRWLPYRLPVKAGVMEKTDGDWWSAANYCCVAKEAAKQWKESQ